MNSLGFLAIFAFLAAVACGSTSTVGAADGGVPGWRNGVSNWNGSGYETTPSSSIQSSSTQSDSIPSGSGDPGFSAANRSTYVTPYTVPTEPGAQTNPYYQSPSIEELQQALSGSSTYPSEEIATSNSSKSDIVDSIDDPYAAIGTPFTPVTNSSDDNETELAAPKTAETVARSTPPTDTAKVDLAAVLTEEPPLEKEVVQWYQYPQRWMKGWDSNAEFGINGSDGNATTLALQTGLELKRKSDLHDFAIDFDYRQASTRQQTTENNGRVNVDYDRLIADTSWALFGKFGMEWDQFKAFDLRLNLNGGLGYHWIREDNASLVTRFGAGASREIGAPIDEWTPEAVFGIDSERQLNSRNKVTAKLDYFPAWEDFSDFRVVADAAWEILLDDSDNLSLKLAATDRYDSTPQGAKPNDIYYSLLLLYKF